MRNLLCLAIIGLSCGSMFSRTACGHDVIVVVLDDSGSMKDMMSTDRGRMSRMDAAKAALEKVIVKLPAETQLGILLMNGVPGNEHWLFPLSPLDRDSVVSRVRSIRAGGSTPLGVSMQRGVNELLQARSKQIYGNYRLLVVTDGEASDNGYLQSIMPQLFSRGITIDVIGVAMKDKHTLAGRAHSYRSASDGNSFEQALEEVFAESTSILDGAGEDFDKIASLPDEFAREAIKALAANNDSIQLETKIRSGSKSNAQNAVRPPIIVNNAPQPTSGGSPSQAPSSNGSWISTVLIAVFVVWFITRKLTRTSRRKR